MGFTRWQGLRPQIFWRIQHVCQFRALSCLPELSGHDFQFGQPCFGSCQGSFKLLLLNFAVVNLLFKASRNPSSFCCTITSSQRRSRTCRLIWPCRRSCLAGLSGLTAFSLICSVIVWRNNCGNIRHRPSQKHRPTPKHNVRNNVLCSTA